MKILIINGPSINMLGIREKEIYGTHTYAELCDTVSAYCEKLGAQYELFQSNHEGAIVDKIQQAYEVCDGIVINPAAYTHTSIAIPDALKAVSIPCVEVHLTDTSKREHFRRHSYVSEACISTVKGHGIEGYKEAIDILVNHIGAKQ